MDDALREACRDALYVLPVEGERMHSARALLFIGERIGYRWLCLPLRPFLFALEPGYRLMARNRPLVGRWIFRSETGGPFSRP